MYCFVFIKFCLIFFKIFISLFTDFCKNTWVKHPKNNSKNSEMYKKNNPKNSRKKNKKNKNMETLIPYPNTDLQH